LTLEDLKSRKGYGPRRGGRNDFGKEKAPDDYDDDMDPEWLDGFDASKKFDFSKQVPLKKMFGEKDGVELEELGGLEDDETEDKTEDNANIQQPISIDEIEKKQLSKFEAPTQPQTNVGGQSQFPQPQQDFGQFGFNQPGVNPQGFMPHAPDAQGFNPNMMQPQPGFQQPGVGGHPPAGQSPGFGAQPGFGPTHGQDFGGPFGGFQQPPMQDFNNPVGNPMGQGFGGFGGEAFGGFNQPFSNPMDSFGGGDMGFGSSLFGAPAGRDEEFEKIFGQPSAGPPGNEKLFHSHNQPSKGQQPGMFGGYGVDQNQFMQTNDDEDEEDDWLMDDQFQSKNLEFIDQHQDTPIKGSQNLPKVGETIDVAYKYVKTEKKRIPKPRKAHVFKPRLREKKRFEKMFDKEIKEETNNKKPHQQDVDMVLVKKFWDMKRDPTDLEMLNLIQNPFSFHVVNKRSSPPQFYLNKDGPIHIGELFMWFNQGLVPKTFQIGHDENCYKYNSRQ